MENHQIIADFHIHSKYSFDSLSSVEKIIKQAKKVGLNCIAITDHNTIKGGVEAKIINCDNDFHVIIGAEIKTEIGDIIGLFLKEEIKERESSKVIKEIKKQNGIILIPHPSDKTMTYINHIEDFCLIEVYNSRTKSKNQFSITQAKACDYQQLLKFPYLKNNFKIVAGSDAHFIFEIGNCKNFINNSLDTLQDSIRKLPINYKCKSSSRINFFGSQFIKLIKSLVQKH